LAIDLPAWLVPVARAAGLRYQGLTFSYLVLRKDGVSLEAALAAQQKPDARHLRVVSDPIVSKGKRELFLCGRFQGGVARARVMRLDRDASPSTCGWDEARRGDVLLVEPAVEVSRGAGRLSSGASAARIVREGRAPLRG
jgi:hypothetical protein